MSEIKNRSVVIMISLLLLVLCVIHNRNVVIASNTDDSVELNYVVAINRIINSGHYYDLCQVFKDSKVLWPVLLPTDLSEGNDGPLKYITNGYDSKTSLFYGDVYRDNRLVYSNTSSLLIVKQDQITTRSSMKNLLLTVYQNLSWTHYVYEYYHNDGSFAAVRLFFQSDEESDGQVWKGWFSWSYDSEGIVYRFEVIVWRIDSGLVNDYDPLTDANKNDLTAYYEFVYLSPEKSNAGVAFVIGFGGSIASIMMVPIAAIVLLFRGPNRKYVKSIKELKTDIGELLWQSDFPYGKVIMGAGILLLFLSATFLFPSDSTISLVAAVFAGCLWFSLFLLIKSFIEKNRGAQIKFFVIIPVVVVFLLVGLFGFVNFVDLLSVIVNSEEVEGAEFVRLMFISLTLAPFGSYIMLYESLYRNKWFYNSVDKAFIILRTHPLVKMVEMIPLTIIDKVELAIQIQENRNNVVTQVTMTLHGKDKYPSKNGSWMLFSMSSYEYLFNTAEILYNEQLIDEKDLKKLYVSKYDNQTIDGQEKDMTVYSKYPELLDNMEKPILLEDLKKKLVENGFKIEPVDDGVNITLSNSLALNKKSTLVNTSIYTIIAIILSPVTIDLLVEGIKTFPAISRPFVFIFFLWLFIQGFLYFKTINGWWSFYQMKNAPSLSINLRKGNSSITIGDKTGRYPNELFLQLKAKKTIPYGYKIVFPWIFRRIRLLTVDNRSLAKNIVSYIKKSIKQIQEQEKTVG